LPYLAYESVTKRMGEEMELILSGTGINIDPSCTAIIVIDMQNDFVDPEGALAQRGARVSAMRGIIPPLVQFLDRARQQKIPVIFIQTVRVEDDVSPSLLNHWQRTNVTTRACEEGGWGAEIIPELKPQIDDIVCRKTRYSAFVGTELDAILRRLGISTLVITGVSTNVCAESTWRHGFMLNYFIIVPEDLVACASELRFHEMALENLKRYFGVGTTSETLVKAWDGA